MDKLTIGIFAIVIIIGGWLLLNKEPTPTAEGTGVLEVMENDFDFGEILMTGGLAKHNFTVKNTGDGPVRITRAKTSCMCTTANIIKSNGEDFGPFGMGGSHGPNSKINMKVLPGEEIIVEAIYDPLAHGPDATGKLVREIFLDTDGGETLKLKFRGEGVNKLSEVEKNKNGFESISSAELDSMFENKDFILIDVHTPEQQHIPGTDYMISYDEVNEIASKIPSKNAKVVLYCRSGNMSKQTAKELVDLGYTNVFELENGLNEWLEQEREVTLKGSIE